MKSESNHPRHTSGKRRPGAGQDPHRHRSSRRRRRRQINGHVIFFCILGVVFLISFAAGAVRPAPLFDARELRL